MIIVSDTTAIRSLLKIGRATLLREIFGDVVVPTGVQEELLKYHSEIPDFLKVVEVSDKRAVHFLRDAIDEGEAQAIILAEQVGAGALLIDDKQGRLIAEKRGIRCIGLRALFCLESRMGSFLASAKFWVPWRSKRNSIWNPA